MKSNLRTIAFLTLVIYLTTQAGFAAPALQGSLLPREVPAAAPIDFSIPQELGTIESVHQGRGPALIHIQTAHGSYEAQQKIRKLLHYLKNHYGMKTVFVEGAVSKLDPERLRLFPEDMPLTMGVMDEMTQKALVKGPELYLLEEKEAAAYGIEKPEVYSANGRAFRAVLKEQEKSQAFLRDLDIQIGRLKARFLNENLRKYLKHVEDFEIRKQTLSEKLSYLKTQTAEELRIDLQDPAYQLDWPMLVRFFKLRELEGKINPAGYEKERKEFLNAAGRFIPHAAKSFGGELARVLVAPPAKQEASYPGTGEFFEKMVTLLPENFNYDLFPQTKLVIGHLILQSEFKAAILLEETGRLEDQIAGKLAAKEEEKKVVAFLKNYRLLQKLFALELTPGEYDKIISNDRLRPSVMIQQFQKMNSGKRVRDFPFSHLAEIDLLFDKALEFYRWVKERDGIMARRVEEKMNTAGIDKAVVVTGGFHAGPFQDYFSKRDFHSILISPRISGTLGPDADTSGLQALPKPDVSASGREAYLHAADQLGFDFKSSTVETAYMEEPLFTIPSTVWEQMQGVAERLKPGSRIPTRAQMAVEHHLVIASLPAGRQGIPRLFSGMTRQSRRENPEIASLRSQRRIKMQTVIAPARRSEMRSEPQEEEFLYRGDAVEQKKNFISQKDSVKKGELDALMSAITEKIQGMIPGSVKDQAEQVLRHLESLVNNPKGPQMYVFDEVRWYDNVYVLAYPTEEALYLGRGLFENQDFNDAGYRELASQILFRTAAFSRKLKSKTALPENFKVDALARAVFGDDTAFKSLHKRFTTLSDIRFLKFAAAQFKKSAAFDSLWDTNSFFEKWLDHDLRTSKGGTVLGETYPPALQAGYLTHALINAWLPLKDLMLDPGRAAEFAPLRQNFNELMQSLVVIGTPVYAFSFFRYVIFRRLKHFLDELDEEIAQDSKRIDKKRMAGPMGIYEGKVKNIMRTARSKAISELPFDKIITERSIVSNSVLPEPVSAAAFVRLRSFFLKIYKKIQSAPPAWVDTRVSVYGGDAKKFMVPAAGLKEMLDLFRFANLAQLYRFGNLLPHQLFPSKVEDVWLGFSHYKVKNYNPDAKGGPRVRIYTQDGSPVSILASWDLEGLYYPDELKSSYISIHRYTQIFWHDLLQHLYEEKAGQSYISALVKLRHVLTKPALPPGYYAPGGVDLTPWIERVLDFHEKADSIFWTQVENLYTVQDFLAKNGKITPELKRNFWYYTLFTQGYLKDLADHLELREGTNRLTEDSALYLLDALMGIYWGGPVREDRLQGNLFLFKIFFDFIRIHPDGIRIPDLERLKHFLTFGRDLPHKTREDFQSWQAAFLTAYPESADDAQNAVPPPLDDELKPDSSYAVARYLIINFIEEGTEAAVKARKKPVVADLYFADEPFDAKSLFVPAKYPWKKTGNKEIVWNGAYKNGLKLPGTNSLLILPGVKDGEIINIGIIGEKNREIAEFRRGVGGLEFFSLPVETLTQSGGAKGEVKGQKWFKVPDRDKITIDGLSADESIDEAGFYLLPVTGNELVRLPFSKKFVSINKSRPEIKEILYALVPALKNNFEEEILVEVQKTDGHIKVFFYPSDASVFYTSAQLSEKNGLEIQDPDSVVPLPRPEPAVAYLNPKTLENFEALNALARRLAPLMATGRGYDTIQIYAEKEPSVHRTHGGILLVPSQFLASFSPGPGAEDPAVTVLKKYLEDNDPVYILRRHLAAIREIMATQKEFSRDPAVQSAILAAGELLKVRNHNTWASSVWSDYEKIFSSLRKILGWLNLIRKIDGLRASPQTVDFGNLKTEGRLQPRLRELMRFSLDAKPFPPFYFIQNESKSFSGVSAMKYGKVIKGEGVGLATMQELQFLGGHFILREGPRGQGEDTRYVILKPRDQEPVVLVFDFKTGRLVDDAYQVQYKAAVKRRHQALKEFRAAVQRSAKFQEYEAAQFQLTLEDFLGHFKGDQSTAAVETQAGILFKLKTFLPNLLVPNHPHIEAQALSFLNLALVKMFFQDIILHEKDWEKRTGILAARFGGQKSKAIVEYFFLMFGEWRSLETHGFWQPANEILNEVFLPSAGLENITHEDYFSKLDKRLRTIKDNIGLLLSLEPESETFANAETGEWTEEGLQEAKKWGITDTPEIVQRYFAREFYRSKMTEEVQEPLAADAPAKKKPKRIFMDPAEQARLSAHLEFDGGVNIGASSSRITSKFDLDFPTTVQIDFGVNPRDGSPPKFPPFQAGNYPQLVVLTHAHRDHAGAFQLLNDLLSRRVPFYMTRESKQTLEFELWHGQHGEQILGDGDIQSLVNQMEPLEILQWYQVDENMLIRLLPAGLLFGAVMVQIATPAWVHLHEGDISRHNQGPVPGLGAFPNDAPVTSVTAESTYGGKPRVDEDLEERRLVDFTLDVLRKRKSGEYGKMLFPALTNGRAQRVLHILQRYFYGPLEVFPENQRAGIAALRAENAELLDQHEIYIDGMARHYTAIYRAHYPDLNNPHVKDVKGDLEAKKGTRSRLLTMQRPVTIIAGSGNLDGKSTSAFYASRMMLNSLAGIGGVNYHDPDGPAGTLGRYKKNKLIKAKIEDFKLSGHISAAEQLELLEEISRAGRPPGQEARLTVYVGHGDPRSRQELIFLIRQKHPNWTLVELRVGESFQGPVVNIQEDQDFLKKWFETAKANASPLPLPIFRPAQKPNPAEEKITTSKDAGKAELVQGIVKKLETSKILYNVVGKLTDAELAFLQQMSQPPAESVTLGGKVYRLSDSTKKRILETRRSEIRHSGKKNKESQRRQGKVGKSLNVKQAKKELSRIIQIVSGIPNPAIRRPLAEAEAILKSGKFQGVREKLDASLQAWNGVSDSVQSLHPAFAPRVRILINKLPPEETKRPQLNLHNADWYDPEITQKAVEVMTALFKKDHTLDRFPGLRKWAKAMWESGGKNVSKSKLHEYYPVIRIEFERRLVEGPLDLEDPTLNQRIQTALDQYETWKDVKRIHIPKTVAYILDLFRKEEHRTDLPKRTHLSKHFGGPTDESFSERFPVIINALEKKIARMKDGAESGLADRLSLAVKKWWIAHLQKVAMDLNAGTEPSPRNLAVLSKSKRKIPAQTIQKAINRYGITSQELTGAGRSEMRTYENVSDEVQGQLEQLRFTRADYQLHTERGMHGAIDGKLGAHPVREKNGETAGTYFAVWAPNAEKVSVVGDFNQWREGEHPMAEAGKTGIWALYIPGVKEGNLYKYVVRGPRLVMSHKEEMASMVKYLRQFRAWRNIHKTEFKADPVAFFSEFPTAQSPHSTASIVWNLDGYKWHDENWIKERQNRRADDKPISIYEIHLGSWKRHKKTNAWRSYRELAPELARYVKRMGFTHVEFMPVMEHYLDASWGYQIANYFAPTSRYGQPDDLMYLIDYLHQQGIGVILDWVPAHFPTNAVGLSNFDGTQLYEHADPSQGKHPHWGTLIPNYGRHEVKSFLTSNALFWLKYYHADGLRVDGVASMLYLDYGRENAPWIPNRYGGRENLEAIAFLRELNDLINHVYPGTLMLAEESTAWQGVSRPSWQGGLGFWSKFGMGWMHDTLDYFSQDSLWRSDHHGKSHLYTSYAFTENFILPLSHDEVVHGKHSLLEKMPGDDWQKFANLRLLLGMMWTMPGKKLLFMGGEFGQRKEWDYNRPISWELLAHRPHRQMQAYVRDLNYLYQNEPALHELDFQREGFDWIDYNDSKNGVLVFLRRGKKNTGWVMVVLNMKPAVLRDYAVGVPIGIPSWYEMFNSNAPQYGGSGIPTPAWVDVGLGFAHGRLYSTQLTLPPLGMLIFTSNSARAATVRKKLSARSEMRPSTDVLGLQTSSKLDVSTSRRDTHVSRQQASLKLEVSTSRRDTRVSNAALTLARFSGILLYSVVQKLKRSELRQVLELILRRPIDYAMSEMAAVDSLAKLGTGTRAFSNLFFTHLPKLGQSFQPGLGRLVLDHEILKTYLESPWDFAELLKGYEKLGDGSEEPLIVSFLPKGVSVESVHHEMLKTLGHKNSGITDFAQRETLIKALGLKPAKAGITLEQYAFEHQGGVILVGKGSGEAPGILKFGVLESDLKFRKNLPVLSYFSFLALRAAALIRGENFKTQAARLNEFQRQFLQGIEKGRGQVFILRQLARLALEALQEHDFASAA